VNGKLYIVGGYAGGAASPAVHCYDPDTDTWTQKTSMPVAVGYPMGAVIDGKLYVAGGIVNGAESSAVYCYDPDTDTWTQKTSMPVVVGRATAVSQDGGIYIIGGRYMVNAAYTYLSSVYRYDPDTDTWTQKATIPTAMGEAKGIPLGHGLIMILGGNTGGSYSRTVYVYSIKDDYFSILSTLPNIITQPSGMNGFFLDGKVYLITNDVGSEINCFFYCYLPYGNGWCPLPWPYKQFAARNFAVFIAAGEKIYRIGGELSDLSISSCVDCYDTITGEWTLKTPMPVAASRMAGVVMGGKIYIAGGSDGDTALSAVYCYDPDTDTWTQKTPMPVALQDTAWIALDGKSYMVGGSDGDTALSIVYCYDPDTNTWTQTGFTPAVPIVTGCALNGKLYMLAYDAENGITKGYVYDPVTNACTSPSKNYVYIEGNVTAGLAFDGMCFFAAGDEEGNYNELFYIRSNDIIWTSVVIQPEGVDEPMLSPAATNGKIYVIPGKGQEDPSLSSEFCCFTPAYFTEKGLRVIGESTIKLSTNALVGNKVYPAWTEYKIPAGSTLYFSYIFSPMFSGTVREKINREETITSM
jgi:N-acetylneuraminic acid mutarotase